MQQNTGSAFVERKVDADGFAIRYVEAGRKSDGTVPVICIHGAGGLRLSPMHEALAKSYHVIAFETPGFGASSTNERSRDMADLATSLCAAIAALGISDYNLMGTSFGAKLATHMALHDRDKGQSLILLPPAFSRPADRPPMATP